MKVFANALYTLLLVVLLSPIWLAPLSRNSDAGHRLMQTAQNVDQADVDSASHAEPVLLGMFCCFILLVFQIARLKFRMKYTYLYLFVGCWLLTLFTVATDDGLSWPSIGHDWHMDVWTACAVSLIPSFGLMYWATYIGFGSRSDTDHTQSADSRTGEPEMLTGEAWRSENLQSSNAPSDGEAKTIWRVAKRPNRKFSMTAVYTTLLFLLLSPFFFGAIVNAAGLVPENNPSVHQDDDLDFGEGSGDGSDKSFLAGLFFTICMFLSQLQYLALRRVKYFRFMSRYLNFIAFVFGWPIVLLMILTGGPTLWADLRSPFGVLWLACFAALIPAFVLMNVRDSEDLSQSGEPGGLSVAGTAG